MQIVAASLWPALALAFAAIFAGLWHADRMRRHLLGFAGGFFALFLAMSLHLSAGGLDPAISAPLFQGLACLSVIAILWGAAHRLGQNIPMIALLVLTAASCVTLFIALRSSELAVALLVQNGTTGLLFAIGAVILWAARPVDVLDRILLAAISLLAAYGLARPLVTLFLRVDLEPLVAREIESHTINLVIQTVLTALLGVVLMAIAMKEAIEIRHKSARIDPVSGFFDYPTFKRNCEATLANAYRLDVPVTLAVLEFDRFGTLQAKWGKDAIDRVIREMCDVVRSWQRESDIIGRIGEHQLGVLIVGVSAQSAHFTIQTLRKEIDSSLNDALSSDLQFTLSASLAQTTQRTDIDRLMTIAFRPLAARQEFGLGVTFVNGVQTQLAPLRAFTEELVVPLE